MRLSQCPGAGDPAHCTRVTRVAVPLGCGVFSSRLVPAGAEKLSGLSRAHVSQARGDKRWAWRVCCYPQSPACPGGLGMCPPQMRRRSSSLLGRGMAGQAKRISTCARTSTHTHTHMRTHTHTCSTHTQAHTHVHARARIRAKPSVRAEPGACAAVAAQTRPSPQRRKPAARRQPPLRTASHSLIRARIAHRSLVSPWAPGRRRSPAASAVQGRGGRGQDSTAHAGVSAGGFCRVTPPPCTTRDPAEPASCGPGAAPADAASPGVGLAPHPHPQRACVTPLSPSHFCATEMLSAKGPFL